MSNKRLIIVDISSFIFRAFFAIRPMHNKEGTPVNAVYGVLSMLLKLLSQYNPSHFILAKDTRGGSFRNELYSEYKANRGAPPEELVPQFALIETLIEAMKIPSKALENYEADDIIGSLVVQFKKDFDEILIASGDKDLMQFIDEKVKMLDTMKDKIYGPAEVKEKMGVRADQIVDYLTLLGDSSDNIPGVKGIGAKGASKLLEEYETLENIFRNIDKLTNKRAKSALEKGGDDATLSKKLVTIVQDLKLELSADEMSYQMNPNDELATFLDDLQFRTLKNKIFQNKTADISVGARTQTDYKVLDKQVELNDLLAEIATYDQVGIEAYFHQEDYLAGAPLCFGISLPLKNFLVWNNKHNFYSDFCVALNKIPSLLIVGHDLRSYFAELAKKEQEFLNQHFDLSQAHFVLNPDHKHDLATVLSSVSDRDVPVLKDLQKESLESEQSYQNIERAIAQRAQACLYTYPRLMKEIKAQELDFPLFELDQKVLPILCKMEVEGIYLDTDYYAQLEEKFSSELAEIERTILKTSDEEINLKSPKQVRELLFEKLDLPIIKKTKTGASTDSDVLTKLDAMGLSDIPGMILKFRELDKLLSTYVKTLPTLVHPDGKIHTHFILKNAATGRLSSEKPNLQNIPIRTDNGRRLRKGFISKEGYVLLGADYSQVELRILAHLSEDPVMLAAFNNDEDIHKQTASEVFQVDLSEVTREQRSFAKAINFGLMYGQSSFGLSQTLNISQADAKSYMTSYFERFGNIKSYLDSLKEQCEQHGYALTMLGRKRFIPDINSTNRQVKSMAERMAINSPIQGSASDIIKRAMITINDELKSKGLKSKMLLQVHDELIFEVPQEEVSIMQDLVRSGMEGAAKLKVPLKVDMNVANNWYDLK